MGHQRRLGAHARCCCRGFTAGMAAADNDNVEFFMTEGHVVGVVAEAMRWVKISSKGDVSRETPELGIYLPYLAVRYFAWLGTEWAARSIREFGELPRSKISVPTPIEITRIKNAIQPM
jgi:hypothetical protein